MMESKSVEIIRLLLGCDWSLFVFGWPVCHDPVQVLVVSRVVILARGQRGNCIKRRKLISDITSPTRKQGIHRFGPSLALRASVYRKPCSQLHLPCLTSFHLMPASHAVRAELFVFYFHRYSMIRVCCLPAARLTGIRSSLPSTASTICAS